jgi:hypothetical protein
MGSELFASREIYGNVKAWNPGINRVFLTAHPGRQIFVED